MDTSVTKSPATGEALNLKAAGHPLLGLHAEAIRAKYPNAKLKDLKICDKPA